MRYEGEIKIILGSIGFAFIPVFVLSGAELSVPSLLIGRLLVAVLFLYFLIKDKNKIVFILKSKSLLLLIWGFAILGSMAFYFFSIGYCGMAVSAAVLGTQPLFIVLLALFFLREKIAVKTWIACFICFAGIVLVSGIDSFSFSDYFSGVLLALASSLLSAVNFIIKKKYFDDFNGIQSVFYQSLFQIPFLIPFVIYNPGVLTQQSFISVILLGLICSVFAYGLIYDGISKVKGQQIGILQSVEYVMPLFIGVFYFNEKISFLTATGISLIVVSCILITVKPSSKTI